MTGLTYKDAGVDIDAGNELVERIKHVSAATRRPEVLGGIGGFGALCEIPEGYRQPVLVSGTDGVGTKLKLAMQLEQHSTIGIDLVAMCSNDIAVVGAEPLLFLDYYATGKLNVNIAADVVAGIGRGCELAGAALVGEGELLDFLAAVTAETCAELSLRMIDRCLDGPVFTRLEGFDLLLALDDHAERGALHPARG